MKCPYCAHIDSKVTDSRTADDGDIRRRRECLSCGERFTTFERLQRNDLLIVKRDGRREEFDREKVIAGLRRACEKRPLPAGVIEASVDDIEMRLHVDGRAEVDSRVIGEMVMERLRGLDEIAYIRFASVYRRFQDIDELKQELAALESRGNIPAPQLPLIPQPEFAEMARDTLIAPREETEHDAPGPGRKRRGGRRRSA